MVMGVSSFWSLALKVHTQNGGNLKQQGIILSYSFFFGQVGVPVLEQKGQEMKEAVLSMSGKRFWKKTCTSSKVFCPSDRRVFRWTRSLLLNCIPFGCDGGLTLPVCKKLAARALYWSSTAMEERGRGGWVKRCLMSSDVSWHIRDKLWPMPKHGSIILYVHGNQKAR